MANLGIANASYYADNSISRANRQVDVSVEKISSNKANVTNGDKTSLITMDNVLKLDIAATNAAVPAWKGCGRHRNSTKVHAVRKAERRVLTICLIGPLFFSLVSESRGFTAAGLQGHEALRSAQGF